MTRYRFRRMTETDYKGLLFLILIILMAFAIVHGNAQNARGHSLSSTYATVPLGDGVAEPVVTDRE